mgnify:CR=1 FL=1
MDFSAVRLGDAFSLISKTLPLLLIRLGASLLFWVIAIVYFLIVGGVSLLVANASELVGVIVFGVGMVGLGGIYTLVYRYVFYMIKAAHVAVMAEILRNGNVPQGTSQLEWGRQRVQSRFTEVNVMFLVDELVQGVIRAFTGTVFAIASWIPGDTVRTLVGIVNTIINYALTYIDEAILARRFWVDTEENTAWKNARDGVVLYAMIWKPILINAVVLMVISYIPFLLVIILFSAPVGFLVNIFNSDIAAWAIILTLVLAWLVKVSVGDSFAMAAIIAAYYRETQSLTPDPEMSQNLEGITDKFKELKDKAEASLTGKRTGGQEAPAPSV